MNVAEVMVVGKVDLVVGLPAQLHVTVLLYCDGDFLPGV